MATITDVILITEHDEKLAVSAVVAEMASEGARFVGPNTVLHRGEWPGGQRIGAGDIHVFSVEDLDGDVLLSAVEAAPWQVPGAVAILLRDDDQELTVALPVGRRTSEVLLWSSAE